ncbi:peptidoglycan DD-metalloendopeptidase family protein [Proteinivorax hydrogeniformans]|uniref:Peptidoglycan DD-metalloendopeptidase family protein n=1 Tax=Proteinivorax hydrogeniformans TaxID=1826727 RepID=A0AAU8HTN2_9FIRM
MSSEHKDNKKFTLMILPHSNDKPLKFNLPILAIQIVGVLILLVLIGFIGFFAQYIDMASSMSELEKLRIENQEKTNQLENLAEQTQNVLEEFKQIEDLQKQLKDLTDIEPEGESTNSKDDERTLFSASRGATSLERTQSSLQLLSRELPSQKEDMGTLISDAERQAKRKAHTPSIRPAEGRVSSPFGYRNHPFTGARQLHTGIDIANATGTPILATANGTVVTASYSGGYGNLIIIDHGYGYTTHYAHLSEIKVRKWQEVEKGEVIGNMGSTGRSTGPHLHYEVRVGGKPVNPKEYY